jgi:hypothetical protein
MNDNAFNALADEQRRTLLLRLLNHNPQTVTKTLPADGNAETDDSARQFETAMYHVHMPKLEDYGYIEWDRGTNEVVKGPQFDEIRPLLECVADHADR